MGRVGPQNDQQPKALGSSTYSHPAGDHGGIRAPHLRGVGFAGNSSPSGPGWSGIRLCSRRYGDHPTGPHCGPARHSGTRAPLLPAARSARPPAPRHSRRRRVPRFTLCPPCTTAGPSNDTGNPPHMRWPDTPNTPPSDNATRHQATVGHHPEPGGEQEEGGGGGREGAEGSGHASGGGALASGMAGGRTAGAGRVGLRWWLPSRPPSSQAEPSSLGPWGQCRSSSGALHIDPRGQARSTVCGTKADGMAAGRYVVEGRPLAPPEWPIRCDVDNTGAPRPRARTGMGELTSMPDINVSGFRRIRADGDACHRRSVSQITLVHFSEMKMG